jgi:hypothetical protein
MRLVRCVCHIVGSLLCTEPCSSLSLAEVQFREASRSFLTSLSFPMLSPLIGCARGIPPSEFACYDRNGGCVSCLPAIASITSSLEVASQQTGAQCSLVPTATQGKSGMNGVQNQVSILQSKFRFIFMFVPGVRPMGTSYCVSSIRRGLGSLRAWTEASVVIKCCN